MHKVKKRRAPLRGPKRPKKAKRPKRVKKAKVRKPRKKRYYKLNLPKPPREKRKRFSFPRPPKPPKVAKPRKDKARTRTKLTEVRYRVINMVTGDTRQDIHYGKHPYDTFNDRTVKPCNMTRVTSDVFNGVKRRCYFDGPSGPIFAVLLDGWPSLYEYLISPVTTQYVWLPFVNHLKVKKLATSNQADLMTAFAEFDETIAMMNVKAIKKSTYGSVKWGWMPLVSDIMAANDAANNVKKSLLSGNTRSHKYNATHGVIKTTGDIKARDGSVVYHKWDVQIKHTGTISYPNDVLAFYDYMGFYPSPKLFWDVIPLTFAIDTILPIGDMLKALSPTKGWVKSANFTGWRVITATVTEHIKVPPTGYHNTVFEANPGPVTFITRDYLSGSALDQKTFRKEIEALKLPTWEQAFDLTYLADAFHDRGKKLLSPHVYRKRKRK